MRIWSDQKGNTIEAEYVNIFGTKVVLKTVDGRQLKVPMAGLSEADKEYLASAIPPKIKIGVNVDKDRDTISSYSSDYGTYNYERKSETIKCVASLEKVNQEPTNREFTASMFVFGKETKGSYLKLLSKTEHKFDFKYGKTTSFNSSPVTVEYTKSDYLSNNGYRYEGYLVVVEDSAGNVVACESTNSSYEEHLVKIKNAKENAMLDDDFDVISRRR